MARASIPTLLSLDSYAAIMGITPAHFNQGISEIVFPLTNRCSDIFYQYSWQSADSVSREDVALEIANAEQEIADQLGWWPAPMWIEQEVHENVRYHRRDLYSVGARNVRGDRKSISTDYGKVIAPGQRAVTLLDTPIPVFSDEDADSFSETVTISVAGITDTTNACDVKVYFLDELGDPEWEIRPARTKTLVGGTLTATFWAWQFIKPELWEELPTEDFSAIDLGPAVYVNEVDVYYEYTDVTATSAVFYWGPSPPAAIGVCSFCLGVGCVACQLTEQEGCFYIRDAVQGIVVPTPGSYDSDDSRWETAAYSVCRDPEQVKLYYVSGNLSQRYLKGRTCEPLSDRWARTIAYLATARLERPFCSCGNAVALSRKLMRDLALSGEESFTLPFELLDSPFGTRRGEIMAWQHVSRIERGTQRGAAAI